MDDGLIIELFRKQDSSAITEAEKKYGKLLMKLAMGILCSKEEAEEVINDTLLAAWNNIKNNPPDNLQAYLCKITRNLALNKFRSSKAKKRNSEYVLSLDEIGDIFPAGETTEETFFSKELQNSVYEFIKALPDEQRKIFLRRYWFFDSIKDIAASWGISESKAKTLLFRTRKKLKEYLEKEGFNI